MRSENGCNSENDSVDSASPCEQLSLARQARGQTVKDIADVLKIPESYVQALEQGNFNVLPGKAFIRGYLKNYARYVGIDGSQLLKALALDVNMGVATDPIPEIAAPPMLERRSSSVIRYVASFLFAALVVAVSYFWWNKTHHRERAPVTVEQNSPTELVKPKPHSPLSVPDKPLEEAESSAYEGDVFLNEEVLSDHALEPEASESATLPPDAAQAE